MMYEEVVQTSPLQFSQPFVEPLLDGVSLNDKLHIGCDLLNSLVGVFLRFREQRVGLAADIEAMLHQVQIIEEDQPALRSCGGT